MKNVKAVFCVLFFAHCSTVFAQTAPVERPAPTLYIRGGTLIDGTGAAARDNGTIVVRGNRIAGIIRENLPVPDGVRVVDARGKYILPGLIDGHTHYAGYAAPLYLHYGITSVISAGGSVWEGVQKSAIEKGLLPGPRIYGGGGPSINGPILTFKGPAVPRDPVDTVEEVRAVVRRNIAQGADGIKVYAKLRPELLRAAIEEAHLHGIPVAGHIAMSAREAVLMGLDSLEHASGISIATMDDPAQLKEIAEKQYTDRMFHVDHATLPESFHYMKPERYADLIKLLVERGTFVVPTLVCYWSGVHPRSAEYEREDRALLKDPAYGFVPELDRRWIFQGYEHFKGLKADPKYQQGYKNLQAFLKQFAQAGGKVVAGDDAVYYELHGISLHRELQLLVDAGLTPMQALLGATRYAAEKFRKGYEVGSVEPGKYADFLIVDANPLEDIRNTQKIHMVIQNGKVLDRRLDGNFVDLIPAPARSEEFIKDFEDVILGVEQR